MITAITVLAVLGAISATVAVVGVSNVKNADRDRQAGAALGASDAGVAQAIEYIRSNGVSGLTCPDATPGSCTGSAYPSGGWINPISPKLVPLAPNATTCVAADDCAKVWIGTVEAYSPPAVTVGTYRVHSLGISGRGPGARNVAVDLAVTPDSYPIGIFGEATIGNGGTGVVQESLFTRGCVYPRETGGGNGTSFTGIDPYWGIPAAAHSTSHVSTANNCGASGYIHNLTPTAAHCPDGRGYSSNQVNAMKFDQSADGGAVTAGSPCYHSYTKTDGSTYPPTDSTFFGLADLQSYGYRPRGLSDAQYAALRVRAQAQGLYNVAASSISAKITAAAAAGISQPVVYYDNSASVALSYSNFPAGSFERAPGSPCGAPIVTTVVEHGDLTFQGGNSNWFDAAIFVPDGGFYGNGGYNILGTVFANTLSLGGGQTFALNGCFARGIPGPILDVRAVKFREDDSKDVP